MSQLVSKCASTLSTLETAEDAYVSAGGCSVCTAKPIDILKFNAPALVLTLKRLAQTVVLPVLTPLKFGNLFASCLANVKHVYVSEANKSSPL